ncbi:hypothetical protein IFM89_007640 [Coptis chinensis]|uniref:Transposase MuDR plant domain-containing protein n=1 Tax=Coptis chinensis TaxID=261450 RepID=A0A835HTS2_9MAGN|nr:hypothetical protein IFM89_007640 [Coptis chinensis]
MVVSVMGTLRGDRIFRLHYDGFWMPFAPGKLSYSYYRGVGSCNYEVNGDEMCYLDLLKEIHKNFGDEKPVSCVQFIAKGHFTYFSNDNDMLKMWDLIKPERNGLYHLFVTLATLKETPIRSKGPPKIGPNQQQHKAKPSLNKPFKPPISTNQSPIPTTSKPTSPINHEIRKSPRLTASIPTTPKAKKQRVVEVRKSPRLNHVPSNTPTTPKAPNPINVQLRKSPRLHPTPTVPMKAKKLLFGHLPEVVSNVEAEVVFNVEAEVRVEPQLTAKDVIKDWTTAIDSGVAFEDLVDNEVEDGGASEDDEVDMFIQVGVEYGPSIRLTTGYISEPSSDEEDIDFMPNPKDKGDNDDEVHDLVDEQLDLDRDNIDEDDDISSFVKLPKNLYASEEQERVEGNLSTETRWQLLPKMEWRTYKECREFMKNLAIYQKFSYEQVRNNKSMIQLKCKDKECGWRAYCTVMSDKHTFKLRNFVETHTCEADEKNRNAQTKAP